MYGDVRKDRMEYQSRVNQLRAQMAAKGIDIAMLLVSADVYYLSGTAASSILIVPPSGDPALFVKMGFERAQRDTWLSIENVRRFQGMGNLRNILLELAPSAKVIGVEKDAIFVSAWERLIHQFSEHTFENISPLILAGRMVKSQAEVELLKKASLISYHGFQRCEEVLAEGTTELEIQCEIEKARRALGADEAMQLRLAQSSQGFGVVASGPNTFQMLGPVVAITGVGTSAAHPVGSSARRVEKGDLVVINKGTAFQGYHADEARTFVVGKASAEQQSFFEIDREMQDAALAAVKPGALVSDVYNAAKKIANRYSYFDYFMGYAQCGVEYVGHGVGLEIDEPPLVGPGNNTVLKPGMVLAIEPKLVVPGWGGIDIEDTVVVTDSGHDILTSSVRELVEAGLE